MASVSQICRKRMGYEKLWVFVYFPVFVLFNKEDVDVNKLGSYSCCTLVLEDIFNKEFLSTRTLISFFSICPFAFTNTSVTLDLTIYFGRITWDKTVSQNADFK